ncbi:carbohydrate esterase family 4 protein [Tulasnella calospora MUT 4182]|uniref:chitin deacetylase n=1 Tax=Tulasnella calospora MUT 4182 TaxID=1051891 RepID=A0A0C3QMW1_9AGAM|nr:carbohydrate esterase family 4 protein [Tulasnella calospora MUT 4182]
MAFKSVLSLLLIASAAFARPTPGDNHADHNHSGRSLFEAFGIKEWAHPVDHPVTALFRRQNANNLTIGSAEWKAQYPQGNPDPTKMPQAWKDALAKAVAAGQIPQVPLTNAGNYPKGTDASDPKVCNSAAECKVDGDIWAAPDGMLGLNFDDGPTDASPRLYDFLKNNTQKATLFYIGGNIRDLPQHALTAFQGGNDLAVHTYTHRWSTSLSNEEFMAELGWTCQIISDLTDGRVPRYWRPPYGDSDLRTRAIAKIFGMTQVDWNQDTDDWEIPEGKNTEGAVAKNFQKWLTGPKSPGLIILEHELAASTVDAFIAAYPLMKSNGWDTRNIPDLFGASYYLNAKDNTSPVVATLDPASGGATTIDLSANAATSASAAAATSSTGAQGSSDNKNGARSLSASGALLAFAMGLAVLAL